MAQRISNFIICALAVFLAVPSPQTKADDLTDADYLQRAKELRAKGEVRGAIVELKNVLQWNRMNAEVRWLLGQIYLDIGEGADAETQLLRAIKLGFDKELGIRSVGEALLLQGKYREIIDKLRDRDDYTVPTRAAVLALHGRAHIGLSQLDEAETALNSAVALDPKSLEVLTGLGALALTRGELDPSAEFLARARKIDSDNYQVKVLEGDIALAGRDFGGAESAFKQASNLRPNYVVPMLGVARAQLAGGKAEDALRQTEKAIKLAPGVFQAHYLRMAATFELKNYDLAVQYADEILGAEEDHVPTLLIRGASHLAQENNEAALSDLSRVVAAASNNGYARRLLGQAQFQLGETEQAYETVAIGAESNPDDLGLLRMAGALAFRKGDLATSRKFLEQAVEHAPEDAELIAQLGLTNVALGDQDAGVKEIERAIESSPDLSQLELRLVLQYIADGKYQEAIKAAKRFQNRHPELGAGYSLEAMALISQGERDAGIALLEETLERLPGDTEASHLLAAVAVTENRLDDARARYQTVLEFNPDHTRTLTRLAGIEFRDGNKDTARALLSQAIEANADAAEPRAVLAQILLDGGHVDESLATGQEGLRTNPEHPALLEVVGKGQIQARKPAEALATFQRLTEAAPNLAAAHVLVAGAALITRDLDIAEEAVNTALSIEPDQRAAKLMYAKIPLIKGDIDTSRSRIAELESAFPDEPAVMDLTGSLALAERRFDDAATIFARLVEVQPTVVSLLRLAASRWWAGERDAAIETLKDWLDDRPEDHAVRYRLGEYSATVGQWEMARNSFAAVVETTPDSAVAQNNLAWTLSELGSFAEALVHAEKAHELAPEIPEIMIP